MPLTLTLLAGCGDGGAERASKPLPVTTQAVAEAPFEQRVEAIATLEADRVVQVASQVSGRVIDLPVRQGQSVRQGQVIVVLDQAQVQAEIASLRAQALTDRLNAERYERLVRQGAASAFQRDQYRQLATASRQTLAAREADLAFRVVRAPHAGIIGEIKLKLGDVLQAGVPFTQLVGNSGLQAEIELPANLAATVRPGLSVELFSPAQGDVRIRTRLRAVDPSVIPGSQSLIAQAPLPSSGPQWRNGMRLRAEVTLQARTQLSVPFAAVTRLAGQSFVYVVGDRAQLLARPGRADLKLVRRLPPQTRFALQVPVQLGGLQNERYPVMRGLQPGQEVITSGLLQLRHGLPVTTR